jgi:hypothetical protein
MVLPPAFIRQTLNTGSLPGQGGIGRILVRSVTTLQSSMGSTAPLDVQVFGRAIDFIADNPTNQAIGTTFYPESNMKIMPSKVSGLLERIITRTQTAMEIAAKVSTIIGMIRFMP